MNRTVIWPAKSRTSPAIDGTTHDYDVVHVLLRRADNQPMGKRLRLMPEAWCGGDVWAPMSTLTALTIPATETKLHFALKITAVVRWRLRVHTRLSYDLVLEIR